MLMALESGELAASAIGNYLDADGESHQPQRFALELRGQPTNEFLIPV